MLRILLVEDERWIRQSLRKMLDQITGFEVVGEARDGREALQLLSELTPHILMTDVRMPILNGLSLAAEAKALLPRIEIVLFSGYNDFEYVREGLRQGAHDYLLKPVQPEELSRVLLQISSKLLKKKEQLPQKVAWMDIWRGYAKHLAEYLWLLDKEKLGLEWSSLYAEWLLNEKDVDVYEFYHQLIYMLNERIHDQYGGQLPEHSFKPLDFTGQALRDAELIRSHLLSILDEMQLQRNWRKSHIVTKALDYIESQYTNPNLSLQEAAEITGMSHPYLSRVFKEEVGKTFVEYVTEYRINKARELLSQPDFKVYEVAGAVGYPDYSYFARVFKRTVGHSPSDYRKLLGIR